MFDDSSVLKQPQYLDRLVGVGLALAALVLYVSTLAPTVLEADAGEFQFVPWIPGIAHPTGYPLYTLLSWLWSHLFRFGEVAWRMNLLSAVWAAVAVGFTYAVTRQVVDATLPNTPRPARLIAGAVGAATFAVTRTFWSQAIVAEVYSLHAMFVAIILWLALKLPDTTSNNSVPFWSNYLHSRTGKLLTFAVGFSLTHHRTITLLFPALILFFWYHSWGSVRSHQQAADGGGNVDGKSLVVHGILLIAPLLLYLYLPLIAPSTPYATLSLSDRQTLILYDQSLHGFWDHIMGTVFTGDLRPAAAGLDRFILTWQLLGQQVGWVGIILALAGLAALWQSHHRDLLLFTGLGFLGFVAFNLIYFIGDIFVLFVPAWLFVSIWIGVGALDLAHWIAAGFVRYKTRPSEPPAFQEINLRLKQNIYGLVTVILVATFILLPIVLMSTRKNEVSQKNNLAAYQRWHQILAEPIPLEAVLLSNDRNEIMPMWYYQYVEGHRPDLLGLFPLIVTAPAYADVGRLLDQALASERPVYLIKPMAGLNLKADLIPEGTLFRVEPVDTPPAYPVNVILPEIVIESAPNQVERETIAALGFDLSSEQIKAGAVITISLHWQAIQELSIDYTSYVHLVDSDGRSITQSDHRPGGDFYPSSYWQVGEILRDHHTLTIPANTPPGVYQLRTGMYYQPQPGVIVGMGNGTEIGQLRISK